MAARFQGDDVAAALIYALAALAGPSVVGWFAATAAQLGAAAFSPERLASAVAWRDSGTLLLKSLGLLATGAGLMGLVTGAVRARFLGPAKLPAARNPMGTAGLLLIWTIFAGLLLGSWLSLMSPATDETAPALGNLVRALLATAATAAVARIAIQARAGTAPSTTAGS